MDTHRILVIDDEPDIPIFIGETLQEEGYTVYTASSACEGVKAAIAELPELILLDMKMPDGDGFAFIRMYLKAIADPAPIILMSASTSLLDVSPFPVVHCLAKPFDLDKLLSLVEKHLNQQVN